MSPSKDYTTMVTTFEIGLLSQLKRETSKHCLVEFAYNNRNCYTSELSCKWFVSMYGEEFFFTFIYNKKGIIYQICNYHDCQWLQLRKKNQHVPSEKKMKFETLFSTSLLLVIPPLTKWWTKQIGTEFGEDEWCGRISHPKDIISYGGFLYRVCLCIVTG